MSLLLDSFWRAAAYCLHPRVVFLSLAPLLLMAGIALVLGYFFWEPALDAVSGAISSWHLMAAFVQRLDTIGFTGPNAAIAPPIALSASTSVIVVSAPPVGASVFPAPIRKVLAPRC